MNSRGFSEALDVAPVSSIQIADAGAAGATPMDIAHAHEAIEAAALALQSQVAAATVAFELVPLLAADAPTQEAP